MLGICCLLGGQLLLIYLVQLELAQVIKSKPDYIYLRVLPGLVWPLILGWFGASWLARRSPGSTAVPLGYGLAGSLWVIVAILQPIFRQGLAQGKSIEDASGLAWSAAVAVTVLVGLSQLVLAFFARFFLHGWSSPLSSAVSAALALSAVATYWPVLIDHPLMLLAGVITVVAFLYVGLPRPFGLSLGTLVLGAGWLALAVSGTFFHLPESPGSLLPNWQWEWIQQGFDFLWLQPEFLTAVVPLLLVHGARDLTLLKEISQESGQASPASCLAGLGLVNLVGALAGGGLPMGVLPGFRGFWKWSGGQVYSRGASFLLLALALLGGFGQGVAWLPLPTLGVLWVALLLTSAAESMRRLTSTSTPLLAAALVAFWGLPEGQSLSAVLRALVWGGMAAAATQKHYAAAAWVALWGCLLASLGPLHRGGFAPDFDGESGIYLLLAVIFQVGWVLDSGGFLRASHESSPVTPESLPPDSSDSPGKSAYDSRLDSPAVEGAESGLGN